MVAPWFPISIMASCSFWFILHFSSVIYVTKCPLHQTPSTYSSILLSNSAFLCWWQALLLKLCLPHHHHFLRHQSCCHQFLLVASFFFLVWLFLFVLRYISDYLYYTLFLCRTLNFARIYSNQTIAVDLCSHVCLLHHWKTRFYLVNSAARVIIECGKNNVAPGKLFLERTYKIKKCLTQHNLWQDKIKFLSICLLILLLGLVVLVYPPSLP